MKTRFLLLLLLPLCLGAPRDIAGEDKKVDTKADHVGTHSHEETHPAHDQRGAKMFSHNQLDLGNIDVSGSAMGDELLIGHQLEIDVHGLAHGQDSHVYGHDSLAHGKDGHVHGHDYAHKQDGLAHGHYHHVHGIYKTGNKNLRAIEELKATIVTIDDDLKKIGNVRNRRDAHNLVGDEALLHQTITEAITYLTEHCGEISGCDAEKIKVFTIDINSIFHRIKETGTISPSLIYDFTELKNDIDHSIKYAEEAVKAELNALKQSLPIDGSWSHWSEFGMCNVTCVSETKRRNRTCTNPPPAFGGKNCTGSHQYTANCCGSTQADPMIRKLLNHCPSVDECVNVIEAKLVELGSMIHTTINHTYDQLTYFGATHRPTSLILFTHYSDKNFVQCAQEYAIDLPQKVLVYEDDLGQKWAAINNPMFLAEKHLIMNICDHGFTSFKYQEFINTLLNSL